MGNFIKAVIFIVVGYFALTYINIHHPVPSAPPINHSLPTADNIPTIDYVNASDGDNLPSDVEYQQYKDKTPMYDPLGPVIPAPPGGSSAEIWRDFAERQCARWKSEPPWYRRGAGCHVTDGNPVGGPMVFDLPQSEKDDIKARMAKQTSRFCDQAESAGWSCKVIDSDGP